MLLSTILDYIASPIISVDADESDYWQPEWLLRQLQSAKTPRLDDLYITEQFDSYPTDTGIRVGYLCIDGSEGTGVIQSWHHYPYLGDCDPEANYAYIVSDQEGSVYAHIADIYLIEREVGYENLPEPSALPFVRTTASQSAWQNSGQGSRQNLSELQPVARRIVSGAAS